METNTKLASFIDIYHSNEDVLTAMCGRMVQDIKYNEIEEEIIFSFSDCEVIFYHSQDCCEQVVVEDINGDWNDLIGTMLLVAEERTNDEPEQGCTPLEEDLWTFYTFRSLKGSVDVRWHGTSNGYYSMDVNINVRNKTL